MTQHDSRGETANFFIQMARRPTFRGRLEGTVGQTLTLLLFHMYVRLKREGMLMSKADAARVLGIEDKSTINNYSKRAAQLGLLRTEEGHDGRVSLLVLTDVGVRAIEEECDEIRRQVARGFSFIENKREHRPGIIKGGDVEPLSRAERGRTEIEQFAGIPLAPHGHGRLKPELEKTVQVFTDTLSFFDKNVASLNGRARAYYELKEYRLALQDVEAVLAQDANNLDALRTRSAVFGALGDKAKCIADARRVVELSPPGWADFAREQLARLLEHYKDFAGAAEVWESFDSPGGFANAAQCYEKLANLKAALKAYQKARDWKHPEEEGPESAPEVEADAEGDYQNEIARLEKAINRDGIKPAKGKKK